MPISCFQEIDLQKNNEHDMTIAIKTKVRYIIISSRSCGALISFVMRHASLLTYSVDLYVFFVLVNC